MVKIGSLGKIALEAAPAIAPGPVSGGLLRVIGIAIDGFGWFPGARVAAGGQLRRSKGDPEAAINRIVQFHTALAGAQGFVTNLGGVATMAVALPANIVGVAIVQARMVAAIAHLRGHDLSDPRVRAGVIMCLVGRGQVEKLVARGELPSTPLVVATAPYRDPDLEQLVARRVLAVLMSLGGGKQAASLITRGVPVIGGGVGAATDSYSTSAVGRYAAEQFISRRPPLRR